MIFDAFFFAESLLDEVKKLQKGENGFEKIECFQKYTIFYLRQSQYFPACNHLNPWVSFHLYHLTINWPTVASTKVGTQYPVIKALRIILVLEFKTSRFGLKEDFFGVKSGWITLCKRKMGPKSVSKIPWK